MFRGQRRDEVRNHDSRVTGRIPQDIPLREPHPFLLPLYARRHREFSTLIINTCLLVANCNISKTRWRLRCRSGNGSDRHGCGAGRRPARLLRASDLVAAGAVVRIMQEDAQDDRVALRQFGVVSQKAAVIALKPPRRDDRKSGRCHGGGFSAWWLRPLSYVCLTGEGVGVARSDSAKPKGGGFSTATRTSSMRTVSGTEIPIHAGSPRPRCSVAHLPTRI